MFYRTFEGIHSVECCCPDIYVKETFIKSNYTWEFLKGGNVIESYNYNNNILNTSGGPSIYCDEFYTNQIGTHTTTGTWDFGADKESLILRFDRGGFALKILELSNHNIHLNGLVKDAYVNGDVVEAITDIKLQQ